jgi:hypothetical protein
LGGEGSIVALQVGDKADQSADQGGQQRQRMG